VRDDLPTGTVTFLFTDVEGSTRLLHDLGAEGYAEALAEHRRLIREACASEGGVEVDTQGDAFFFAFPTAPSALAAASAFTEGLTSGPIAVRVGLHTGTPLLTEEGYVGDDVHFAARVAASAHGGQVVLSAPTAEFADGSLTDLGEHRLKDIGQAVSIYQLGTGTFPPLRTISNTNLPRPASSFVGRDREVEEVQSLFGNCTRLLTLTGPGGSGKTRLALEVASELVPEFSAGVFWVALAALRDPALVTETIAQTLGAKDGLVEHVGERELLLLPDNLEQVVAAAPELAALVEACPNLKLLCTSRELLRVRGEVEYAVLPLAEPEAVSLFCERARLEPTDEIAELCARLDNLPLAVELAAARTKALSPTKILERLSQRLDLLKGGRDADPRQQTLRATIEWSYDLLTPEEQQLFACLAVFRGGCTLEAAEEVCVAELDTLQSLVEKSLLRFTNERYWMLETIREYAAERLEASGGAEQLGGRHAEWYLALAETAYPHLTGSPKAWLDRLDGEHDNMRAALDGLATAGETQLTLQLAGALWRYWFTRGDLAEGARRLESALAADSSPTTALARALTGASALAEASGEAARARLRAEEALALHRKLGDAWGVANSVFMLGYLAHLQDDWVISRQLLEESLASFRELGDEHYTLLATFHLAWVYERLGDPERSRLLHEENLHRARATGNKRIEAASLGQLAFFAREAGQLQEALSMLGDSLRIRRELGERVAIAEDISRIARTFASAGEAATAARLLSGSRALYEELGARAPSFGTDRNEETLAIVRAQLDDVSFDAAWEQGSRLSLDEAVALALGGEVDA
jgi:predicted ATPase